MKAVKSCIHFFNNPEFFKTKTHVSQSFYNSRVSLYSIHLDFQFFSASETAKRAAYQQNDFVPTADWHAGIGSTRCSVRCGSTASGSSGRHPKETRSRSSDWEPVRWSLARRCVPKRGSVTPIRCSLRPICKVITRECQYSLGKNLELLGKAFKLFFHSFTKRRTQCMFVSAVYVPVSSPVSRGLTIQHSRFCAANFAFYCTWR